MSKKKVDKNEFEERLNKLKEIVTSLEDDDLSLSQSLEVLEEGIKNYKECTKILDNANERITILLEEDVEVPFKDMEV